MTLAFTMAACTKIGTRSRNEDAMAIARSAGRVIAVVCDGAGGHHRGAQAANMAVDTIMAHLQCAVDFSPPELGRAVDFAQAALLEAQTHYPDEQRSYSTVVAAWIDVDSSKILWAHAGDSRLYRARLNKIDFMTSDDSVVAQLVKEGVLDPALADAHPERNHLLFALGSDDVRPHLTPTALEVRAGDAYLLCSDGWWGVLSPHDIEECLREADTPQQWIDVMSLRISSARRKRQDNYSAVAVWVGSSLNMDMVDDDETVPPPAKYR